MTPLAERLAARTLELVNIPSESGHEEAIREHLLELVPSQDTCAYAGDEVFFYVPERRPGMPLVVLAGHYDTVPAQDNLPGRIEDGVVHGLGTSDMKSGVAVALELVRDLAESPAAGADVALVVFGREELPVEHDPLPALLESVEVVHEAALAILLEPTDGVVHAGCLGNVIATLTFHGRSGHSARPWDADSAITHAVEGLRHQASLEGADVSPGDQAEPLRRGRGEFGEHRGTQLIDRIESGTVEQTLDRVGAGADSRVEARSPLRQSVSVAIPPEALPAAPPCLGSPVAGPDGLERKLRH